jgi:hypothetical protein
MRMLAARYRQETRLVDIAVAAEELSSLHVAIHRNDGRAQEHEASNGGGGRPHETRKPGLAQHACRGKAWRTFTNCSALST